MMVAWFVLRLVLFFAFSDSPAPPASDAVLAFVSGLWRDFLVAVWFTLPLLAWLLLAPTKTGQQLVTSSPFSVGSVHNLWLAWRQLDSFDDHVFRLWLALRPAIFQPRQP